MAVVALISPYRADRARARSIHRAAGLQFQEIWIDTPLHVCQRRDPKGIYARARSGELHGVTGVDAPYEPPLDADVRISGDACSPDGAAAAILGASGLVSIERVPAA